MCTKEQLVFQKFEQILLVPFDLSFHNFKEFYSAAMKFDLRS